nr:immunoglobulin light chain junction region [Macaca mulatta]MOX84648.1 immunoglobulin light chain junction region [Macaca mulatta]MOX84668.1 immunoglobulin light chain junction region [Macaca mulatta]MOX84702.1 immunoglobulin light chain junction region [Macaca mulatta]MOX84957.1 immunoglobulin light chain junction region [Macaca mulatta]
CQQHAESPLTF